MPAPFNNLAALAHKTAKSFVHLNVRALGILEPHKVRGQINDRVQVQVCEVMIPALAHRIQQARHVEVVQAGACGAKPYIIEQRQRFCLRLGIARKDEKGVRPGSAAHGGQMLKPGRVQQHNIGPGALGQRVRLGILPGTEYVGKAGTRRGSAQRSLQQRSRTEQQDVQRVVVHGIPRWIIRWGNDHILSQMQAKGNGATQKTYGLTMISLLCRATARRRVLRQRLKRRLSRSRHR